MSPLGAATRAGFGRGLIELRQTFTNPSDLWNALFPAVILLAVVLFMGDATVPGTDFSLGARTLPSGIGMGIAFGGLMAVASILVLEREDGTLLRAKATPNGMLGYLIGKIVTVAGTVLAGLLIQLIPAAFVVDGLALGRPSAWFTLTWVVLLGLVATMPIGAVIGSLIENPRNLGLVFLPLVGLIATSGIFYPITAFPGWLQGLGQVFPIYWLGLGMRSAMLPDALAAVEFGGSWRHLETFGVLGAWAVAGLVVAPWLLRRMARRESGSAVAARKDRAMQRAM